MGWLNDKPPKPPTQGVWEAWTYGDTHGWTMRCGAFEADIRQHSRTSPFYLTINNHPYMNHASLNAVMCYAEQTIVQRIDAVLPSYELIKARLASRPPAA